MTPFVGWLKRLFKLDDGPLAPHDLAPLPADARGPRTVIEAFHHAYYDDPSRTWDDTYWLGTKVLKCPLDLWIYQEIVSQTQPDLIIETGTRFGGSALYLASLCDLRHHGTVVSIDIEHPDDLPRHPRLTYITGSSTAESVLAQVALAAEGKARVMVILDSDHSRAHVARELAAYKDFVSVGCYMIVEDTNINGHPVLPEFGEGPMEALADFLIANDHFTSDPAREKFLLTFNPQGYLLKTREAPTS